MTKGQSAVGVVNRPSVYISLLENANSVPTPNWVAGIFLGAVVPGAAWRAAREDGALQPPGRPLLSQP